MTPDGRHAYVASTGSKTVSVIDTAVNAVVATVPFDSSPQYVAVSPDGRNVYVEASGVSVIDTSTNAVVTTYTVLRRLGYRREPRRALSLRKQW